MRQNIQMNKFEKPKTSEKMNKNVTTCDITEKVNKSQK